MAVNERVQSVCYKLSNYACNLDFEAKLRYIKKLNGLSSEDYVFPDPYCVDATQWNDEICMWPIVRFADIYVYLTQSGDETYSDENLRNYKSLSAYQYVLSDKVQRVQFLKDKDSEFYLFSTEVQRSQKISEQNHKPWAIIKKNGTIKTAHCTCMSGLGETCSHVAALLFKIELACSLHANAVAPTEVLCKWKNAFSSKVKSSPLNKLDLTKSHWRAQNKRKVECVKIPDLPDFTDEELKRLKKDCPYAVCVPYLDSLKNDSNDSDSTDTVSEADSTDTASEADDELPPTLREIVEESNLLNIDVKTHLISSFNVQNCLNLMKCTIQQYLCPLWFKHKEGRITASNLKQVLRRKKWDESFTLKLISPKVFSTPATLWGQKSEAEALKIYEEQMKCHHVNFKLEKCGLLVNPKFPHLGASPDGLSSCDCCGKGVVEVKCPFSHKEKLIKDIINNDTKFYLSENGSLKTDHTYYYQVQGQMAVSGLKYGDFVVWTKIDTCIKRIYFDEEFWKSNEDYIEMIFYKYIVRCLQRTPAQ